MPNIISKEIQYLSEALNQTVPVRFKIQEEAHGIIGDRIAWSDPTNSPCPVAESLSMRYLRAVFPDPADPTNFLSVQVPVASPLPAVIELEAEALRTLGAVCIDFVGERWARVPGIGTPGVAYTLDPALEYVGVNYQYNVQSYVTTSQVLKVSIENRNAALFTAQTDCMLLGAAPSVCTTNTSGFKPRAGILTARNTGTGGIIKRRAIFTTNQVADIRTCLQDMAPRGQCIGYEGEVHKNLHLSLPAVIP